MALVVQLLLRCRRASPPGPGRVRGVRGYKEAAARELRSTGAVGAGRTRRAVVDRFATQSSCTGSVLAAGEWLELRRLPPIMGFVGSGPGLVIILA